MSKHTSRVPRLFISYAREDEAMRQEFGKHLRILERQHIIEIWHDRMIAPGAKWAKEIDKELEDADIIVCLVSADFLDSDYCYGKEMKRALERHQAGEACVVPIIVRASAWELTPLAELQALPTDAKPITQSRYPDQAWTDVVLGIKQVAQDLQARLPREAPPAPEPVVEPPVERPPARKRPSETSGTKPRVETPAKERRPRAPAVKPAEPPRAGFEPELVPIPAGPFLMGSDDGDKDERPQHTVELSAYWIGKYSITNAEYQAFRDAGHRQPKHWKRGTYPKTKGNHPVVHVSWEDATAYCEWLSKETGKDYQLPTEAQWEKAARGEDGRFYPWGNEWDASRLNSYEGSPLDTSPVGQFSPKGDSPYDVADMAGNVWEWCADWYDKAEYKRRGGVIDPEGGVIDPEGPAVGEFRVLRGVAFNELVAVRCAFRYSGYPDYRGSDVGFRVVLLP